MRKGLSEVKPRHGVILGFQSAKMRSTGGEDRLLQGIDFIEVSSHINEFSKGKRYIKFKADLYFSIIVHTPAIALQPLENQLVRGVKRLLTARMNFI